MIVIWVCGFCEDSKIYLFGEIRKYLRKEVADIEGLDITEDDVEVFFLKINWQEGLSDKIIIYVGGVYPTKVGEERDIKRKIAEVVTKGMRKPFPKSYIVTFVTKIGLNDVFYCLKSNE